MIIAEKMGQPIDPDVLWEKYFSNVQSSGVFVSKILDIAREFGIATAFDVMQDIDGLAVTSLCQNVSGILMLTERIPGSLGAYDSVHRHVWALHHIQIDIATRSYQLEVESANQGEPARVDLFYDYYLQRCLRSFLILMK